MTPDAPEIVIIGGGGHTAVLVDALKAAGEARSMAILDADPFRHGADVLGVTVAGGDDLLERFAAAGTRWFIVGLGGARNNRPRAALFEHATALGLAPLEVVHPKSIVSAAATIGSGAQILAGAIVNARAIVGRNVIVNTAAVIEHDCVVEDHAHVATGAKLASTVTVRTLAHVGAGATVRQLIEIGAAAVVGAGAVVVRDVAAQAVVTGVPAKRRTP